MRDGGPLSEGWGSLGCGREEEGGDGMLERDTEVEGCYLILD